MAIYRIADLNIEINNKYNYLDVLCKDYLAPDQSIEPDFSVFPSPSDYDTDKENLKEYPDYYLESVSIYRQIARKILEYNGIILHACVIEMEGSAFAFSAPSGTGKSTHARLWEQAFEGKAKIINGDKPLVRYIDGKLYVYGTPWCGKEGYNQNTKAELDSICFIERSKENVISRLNVNDALQRIFTQLLLPETEAQSVMFFDILEIITKKVKFFKLGCNMDIEAAYVAHEGMTKDDR